MTPRSSARCTRGNFSTDRRRRAGERGFTLIELMVVVLIIGLMATGIVLSTNITGRDRDLETESERAFQLMKYAREKAALQTREFGLYLGYQDYQFLTFDPRKGLWRAVDEDDALRARKLPDGLRFHLVVEGREVVLKLPDDKEKQKKKSKEELEKEARAFQPHIMIFSNGDLTSFQLTMEREDPVRSVTIKSNDKGEIEAGKLIEAGRT